MKSEEICIGGLLFYFAAEKKGSDSFVFRFRLSVHYLEDLTVRIAVIVVLSLLSMHHLWAQERSGSIKPFDPSSVSTKPYTRWWWFADNIKPADTRAQLVWLKEQGFGGVEVAWVYPIGGGSAKARMPWLSKTWTKAVETAARQCDSLGLGFDMTFGTLWPFGDSMVPKKDGALVYGEKTSPAKMRLTWEHPTRGRVLNHLDSAALGRYSKRLFSAMAPAMKSRARGLFCDSWEVETRKLWTRGFGERFEKEFGYDIEPLMDSLYLPGFEAVHYDYMALVSRLVLDEFYGPFTSLAHERGAYTRAQCSGAPVDLIEAYRKVDIPETEAILFEPGFARIAASAAALDGKKIVSSETFTCLYGWKGWPGPSPHQGEERVEDLKLLADALFANGVNRIVWHGMPYNPPGRNEQFYASVHVGPKSALALSLSTFNLYMTEVSDIMRRGKTYADVAVYLPLEDAWMGVELPDSLKFPWAWGEYELRYLRPPAPLKNRQALWVNGRALRDATVRDNKLYTGEAVFNSLVVDAEWMSLSTLKALVNIVEQGFVISLLRVPQEPGRIPHPEYAVFLNRLISHHAVARSLESLPAAPLIEGEDLPDFWCREDGDDLYVFIAHPAARNLSYPLKYGQGSESVHETREVLLRWQGRQLLRSLNFPPGWSMMLLLRPDGRVDEIPLPDVVAPPR